MKIYNAASVSLLKYYTQVSYFEAITGFDLTFWNAVVKFFVTDLSSNDHVLGAEGLEENFYFSKLSQTNYFP